MMSWLTVIWSACAAASGLLAIIHLFLFFYDRRKGFYLWSSLACIGASMMADSELLMMLTADSPERAQTILLFQNVLAGGRLLKAT